MENNYDKDLTFLTQCSNDGLQLLCDFITKDKDGKFRYTETLSITEEYKINYPHNMKALIPLMIEELHYFGGNTILNTFRKHGVPYREILEEVCEKLKVNYNKSNSTSLLEQYLLQKILIMSVDKMKEEDVKHLSSKLTKSSLKDQIHLLKAGSPVYIRLITMVVANLAQKAGLKQATGLIAKFAGGRFFAILTGPIGWTLSALWTLYDIAGPAYRVLVPATITIAYLRNTKDLNDDELDDILR